MKGVVVSLIAAVLALSLIFIAYLWRPDALTNASLHASSFSGHTGCNPGNVSFSKNFICSDTDFDTVVSRFAAKNSRTKQEIKVLVTGAGGFIASHVADFCQNQMGFQVVALDDLSGGFMENLEQLSEKGGKIEIGDIQDVAFIKGVFERHGPFDYVYHLAAYAAEGLSHFIRNHNYNNNLVGSVNLLNAALAQKPMVKAFVFTSSIAAYGASDGRLPLTEDSPKHPEDPYGIAKMAFELDLQAAHHMFGINYIIFRPHNVYGPRQNIADKFRNAVGIFMNQILRNQPITIFGDGEQTRAFSYISDVANVIAASVAFPNAYNNDFFVGSDQPYSLNQLASAVTDAMGSRRNVVHLEARKEVTHAFASHFKMKCFFRPPPTIALPEGLAITAEYVKQHGSYEPTGYSKLELKEGLPPSWNEWLSATRKTETKTHIGKRHNSLPSIPSSKINSTALQASAKEKTEIVVFVPTVVSWADRRVPVQQRFNEEGWTRSEAVLLFVFGSRSGPRLEYEIDTSSVANEGIEYIITPCRDFGDEYNNANGTSSTTCKVYEGLKYIVNAFQAKYVWRGADDAYLNLKFFLSLTPTLPKSSWYLGRLRVPLDAWFMNRDLKLDLQPELQKLYGLYMFGQYMGGMGYAISWDVATHIAAWIIPPHQTWVEDVMVGMWLNPFQIAKVDMQDLFLERDDYVKEVSWNRIPGRELLILHHIKDEDWANLDSDGIFHPNGLKNG